MSPIRLILVDDHTLVREGIRSLLGSLEGIEIVGEAGDGNEALGLMIAERLDLSVKTVETHRTRLMDRLGIHGLAALVRYAVRLGIVRAES